ncbi:Methyltransferase type 12 [Magnetococcus marinus MC-1]|uniref:Methyltransferase type 12 n=1 Tax=Magnetococcus marinus (strain ATCC BAA-1437 / JCM 17883 / MC-1) TaxID=156889 RepID=A0L924_MAGMM|nr:class I SAM-dependent methyltransferase [Magnetococcus marinus]ABK44467.1 Methyltransferase type 12 [Magnetococcus marinus MC-1]
MLSSHPSDPSGNYYDKYGTRNFIARRLMAGFTHTLFDLVQQTRCTDIHEVGCGEGKLAALLSVQANYQIRASDRSAEMIAQAKTEHAHCPVSFFTHDLYTLTPDKHGADLILCCEVMEHLADPEAGMAIIHKLARKHVIFSVPREPLWRVLNMARGSYLMNLGNTPGHIQHWSTSAFTDLVEQRFKILSVRTPIPWTFIACQPR